MSMTLGGGRDEQQERKQLLQRIERLEQECKRERDEMEKMKGRIQNTVKVLEKTVELSSDTRLRYLCREVANTIADPTNKTQE